MNRFTKLILTSAIISTSGFAATDSYVSGNLVVDGTINQNKDADVTGVISVNGNGVFNNKATLSFKSDAGLAISVQRSSTLADYQEANATYNLGVTPIGQYPAGSIIAVCDILTSGMYTTLIFDYKNWDTDIMERILDRKLVYAKNKVAFETIPEDLPEYGRYGEHYSGETVGTIKWTFDSSLETYGVGAVSGVITGYAEGSGGWASLTTDLDDNVWHHAITSGSYGESLTLSNKVSLTKSDVENLPDTINWTYEKEET